MLSIKLPKTHDWGKEWRNLQKFRRHADDAAYWDGRATTFGRKDSPNPYVERFLELADIKPDESVLDMGCGTGALSVPLGKAGNTVVAADFSRGMLAVLTRELTKHNISCVESRLVSWEDDWDAFGLGEDCVDVCLASRSIATTDLEQALLKLTRAARRRVCITLPAGFSPGIDERVLAAVGFDTIAWNDYTYAFNILAARNIKVEVSYIESARHDTFASFDEAYMKYVDMVHNSDIGRQAREEELEAADEKLRAWLADELVENERAGLPDSHGATEGTLRLRTPRVTSWAFLAWNV